MTRATFGELQNRLELFLSYLGASRYPPDPSFGNDPETWVYYHERRELDQYVGSVCLTVACATLMAPLLLLPYGNVADSPSRIPLYTVWSLMVFTGVRGILHMLRYVTLRLYWIWQAGDSEPSNPYVPVSWPPRVVRALLTSTDADVIIQAPSAIFVFLLMMKIIGG
jgi:hypothetical protein